MTAYISIYFVLVRNTVSMNTTATALFSFGTMQLPIPFELREKSATCNYLINSTCPIKRGSILLYTLDFFIDPVFPIVSIQPNGVPTWQQMLQFNNAHIDEIKSEYISITYSVVPPTITSNIFLVRNLWDRRCLCDSVFIFKNGDDLNFILISLSKELMSLIFTGHRDHSRIHRLGRQPVRNVVHSTASYHPISN